MTEDDITAWLKSDEVTGCRNRCLTCAHESASADVVKILEVMERCRQQIIRQPTIGSIFAKVQERNPSYGAGIHAFTRHLHQCVPELWAAARGK